MYSGHAAQADRRTGRDRPRNRAGSSGIWRMATSGGSDAGAPVVLALVPTCFAPPGGQRRVRQSAQDGRGADATGVDALLPSRSQRLACLLAVTQPGQGRRGPQRPLAPPGAQAFGAGPQFARGTGPAAVGTVTG